MFGRRLLGRGLAHEPHAFIIIGTDRLVRGLGLFGPIDVFSDLVGRLGCRDGLGGRRREILRLYSVGATSVLETEESSDGTIDLSLDAGLVAIELFELFVVGEGVASAQSRVFGIVANYEAALATGDVACLGNDNAA